MIAAPHRHTDATTPLAHSALNILITDLLAEYELRHVFHNPHECAIEAVYSFPVPLDAAFLGMTATLAGETLAAQVQPARAAERRYDQAIGDGDSAVLLEQVEPGMLCVNLGNLKPGEDGDIVLRFAAALGVADATARFCLPLVHRPRYGRSRLDAVVTPTHDFAVEHPLDAQIHIRGLLATCPVSCTSAGARFSHTQNETVLHLQNAMLDRDLVLNFALDHAPPAQAHLVADDTDCLAILHAIASLPPDAPTAPRDICLLLDGSGSMNGDAIAQSRQALIAVADALRDTDRIQIIRFGTRPHSLFRRPLQASERVKDSLRQLVSTVNADLGGTEMAAALESALAALARLDGPPEQKIVILVTDGAVTAHELEAVTAKAVSSGVRIFSVAVGSSAGADVLAPLSQATCATLERAVPAEPIDDAVMRQFRRARHQPLTIDADWGDARVQPIPAAPVYPGDALALIARCSQQNPPRQVTLNLHPPHALQGTRQTLLFEPPRDNPALRAWAGQQLHACAAEDTRESLALRYGLITPQTKAVLVKLRAADDKADGLPRVMPVAHMLPEGMVSDFCMAAAPPAAEYFDIPCFLRRSVSEPVPTPHHADKPAAAPPPTFTQEQKNAFAHALAELLLADILRPNLYLMTCRLAPEHRAPFKSWLKQALFTDHLGDRQRFDPLKLLQRLLDEGATLILDDDQEAMLTARLLRYRASAAGYR